MTISSFATMLYSTIMLTLRRRVEALCVEPERGSGGVSLEHVLIAIGGVVAAGIVVAAIVAVIHSKTADLNP
ncbi:MAG: hypothetical protein J0I11_01125 [Actinobacteria bacterium]|nr:hypothetical protein [Actinomycetota bacterium]